MLAACLSSHTCLYGLGHVARLCFCFLAVVRVVVGAGVAVCVCVSSEGRTCTINIALL